MRETEVLYSHTSFSFLFFSFTLQYYPTSPTLMYSLAMVIVCSYDYHIVIYITEV